MWNSPLCSHGPASHILSLHSATIRELLSSEQAFVDKLHFLESHYLQHLDRAAHVPPVVASQKAVIFRNVQDISRFHSRWVGSAWTQHWTRGAVDSELAVGSVPEGGYTGPLKPRLTVGVSACRLRCTGGDLRGHQCFPPCISSLSPWLPGLAGVSTRWRDPLVIPDCPLLSWQVSSGAAGLRNR